MRGGTLVAAAEEERFRRVKHWAGFPSRAIAYCLQEAKVGLGDVTHIAVNRSARANFIRKLTYQIRATYEKPSRVSIERISGDLETLRVQWTLQSDGDYTIAHYAVELAPGFWVPRWLVRSALKHDLPKMLRALRARAEPGQGR